jgi:hypothetical protein
MNTPLPYPLILDSTALEGGDQSARQAQVYSGRFSKVEDIVEVMAAATDGGAGAVVCSYSDKVIAALEAARKSIRLEVYPIVLNAAQYARDLSNRGTVGAAWARLARVGVGGWPRLAWRSVTSLPGILARDFMALLPPLLEMEMASFARFHPSLVLLHSQMTDLALALGNRALFQLYADYIRRVGVEPGLQTRNLGTLLPQLQEWGVDIHVVAAPFNSKGYKMKPSRALCEAALTDGPFRVIAEDVTAQGSTSLEEAQSYLRQHKIAAVAHGVGSVAEARQSFLDLGSLFAQWRTTLGQPGIVNTERGT